MNPGDEDSDSSMKIPSYRDLYIKSPIMLHSIDRSGRLIEVSDFWVEVLGYTRDEVI